MAAYLSAHGVGLGESVVVMLGNQVELWETMFGVIKLGAVVMPTTTAVGSADLVDRLDRGAAKAVICNVVDAPKFEQVPGEYVRIVVGDETPAGWLSYSETRALGEATVEHPGNASTDRLLLYFTSGTTSRPKLVEHTHITYPVGHLAYVGRTDDVFKASDYKISPFELESVLIEYPAVAEAAVVPAPDPIRLAVPKAYVSLVDGYQPDAATAQSILRYARQNLAPYQRVRRLEFLELPKTISGKIRRVELRKREHDADAPPGRVARRPVPRVSHPDRRRQRGGVLRSW